MSDPKELRDPVFGRILYLRRFPNNEFFLWVRPNDDEEPQPNFQNEKELLVWLKNSDERRLLKRLGKLTKFFWRGHK